MLTQAMLDNMTTEQLQDEAASLMMIDMGRAQLPGYMSTSTAWSDHASVMQELTSRETRGDSFECMSAASFGWVDYTAADVERCATVGCHHPAAGTLEWNGVRERVCLGCGEPHTRRPSLAASFTPDQEG